MTSQSPSLELLEAQCTNKGVRLLFRDSDGSHIVRLVRWDEMAKVYMKKEIADDSNTAS